MPAFDVKLMIVSTRSLQFFKEFVKISCWNFRISFL